MRNGYHHTLWMEAVMPRARVDATKRLRDCAEGTVGLALPRPLSDRVDALVSLADDHGERTSRKELIAALILDAPVDGSRLAKLLSRYRLATARDALLDPESAGATIPLAERRPGPRARQGH
jgi:hypothetical protein